MVKNNLIGLPDGNEVLYALERIKTRVESLGVKVVDNLSETEHARFVGIFENRTITLYPKLAPTFALWFTVAHLYGHMVQLANKTPRVDRANELVLRIKNELTADEVQLIYDHEREAAELGRALIADVETNLAPDMETAYNRFFHADFRYLINFIETGEQGVDVFAKYWKREPVTQDFIEPDPRKFIKISDIPGMPDRIVVV